MDKTLSRWRDRIFLGLTAAAIVLLLEPWWQSVLTKAAEKYAHLPGLALCLALLLLLFMSINPVCKGRWCACLGLRHILSDPPLWVAALVGLIPLLVIFPFDMLRLALLLIALCGAMLLSLCCDRMTTGQEEGDSNKNGQTSATSALEDLNTLVAIRGWVNTDDPVISPDNDRFGYLPIAERTARRLQEGQSVAVVGELGSGKTTLGHLVEQQLQGSDYLYVQISLWPYESASAAVSGILSALLKTVSQETNVIALRGLPANYVEATAEAGGGYAALARLLTPDHSPEDLIQGLNELCQRIGKTLVVWIDDAERFEGKHRERHQSDGNAFATTERIEPIQSLLHLLDECKKITVVMADTGLENRIDPEKIARYIERISPLETDDVKRLIDTVRDACHGGWPKEVLLPDRSYDKNNDNYAQLHKHIDRAIATPRKLKQCLRYVIETWEKIPGEIDFDSMLALTAIRVASPNIFTTLDRYSALIRGRMTSDMSAALQRRNNSSNDSEPESYGKPGGGTEYDDLANRLTSNLRKIPESLVQDAVANLLRYLVRFFSVKGTGDAMTVEVSENYADRSPEVQHIMFQGQVDYFRRYLDQAVKRREVGDQQILNSIKQWKGGDRESLHALLLRDEVAEHAGAFWAELTLDELDELLSALAKEETHDRVGDDANVGTRVVVNAIVRRGEARAGE